MIWNEHSNLRGKHATLGASNYHWVKYDLEKLNQVIVNNKKKEEGTILHDFASQAIKLRIKLRDIKNCLNQFVNDSILYAMDSEKILYYSDNVFGTADAISFRDNILRIFDLKTGISKPSFVQLDIYAALFCLEYSVNPFDISIEERLYQGYGYEVNVPDPEDIKYIMDKIILFDKHINDPQ